MKLPNRGWLTWGFDGVPFITRTSKNQVFKFEVNLSQPVVYQSFYEEVYNNARAMRDYYSGTFDVLLSGGIDSEVVVRAFKDVGIKHNTLIFKHDYNQRDVSSAIEIAESLGIPFRVIDFPLQSFFENDAYDTFKKSGCLRAGRLPQIKFLDYTDNIPVMGDGDAYWMKAGDRWLFEMTESCHACSIYMASIGRESICDWYEFTPELMRSYQELPRIQQLIHNELPGKLSSWSSRLPIFSKLWPDIKEKPKLTGLEGDGSPGTSPQFVIELQERMTNELGEGTELWLTEEDTKKLWQNSTKN